MGKAWDTDKGDRDKWIEWLSGVMVEALRVLKPGGHALVWSLPRTSHWTGFAVENAGFECREKIYHLFGSGFPKSLNISKSIDKHSGTTPEAKQWDGWGTALKPAVEEWILCRKPLREKSVAENVLKWGTGGINIDGCRVAINPEVDDPRLGGKGDWSSNKMAKNVYEGGYAGERVGSSSKGRFPANLILSHSPDCKMVGYEEVGSGSGYDWDESKQGDVPITKNIKSGVHYGKEEIEKWECVEGCPYKEFEKYGIKKSGDNCIRTKESSFLEHGGLGKAGDVVVTYGDKGSPARFFYCSKASKVEREMGCDGLEDKVSGISAKGFMGDEIHDMKPRVVMNKNNHPTVKSISLMKYLIKLITPPNGVVLDMFAGSGSTLVAAKMLGYKYIGIEKEKDYCEIAEKRVSAAKVEQVIEQLELL